MDEEYLGEQSGSESEFEQKPELQITKPLRKRRAGRIRINLANCKYDIVLQCALRMGWKPCGEDDDWTITWMDFSVSPERLMKMERYQVRPVMTLQLTVGRESIISPECLRSLGKITSPRI